MRDLRNDGGRILDRVAAGEEIAHGLPLSTVNQDGFREIADLDLRSVAHPDARR